MKPLGYFLTACVALAALRAAVAALLVAFIIGLLWGALNRPQETFGFVAFCLLAGLVQSHPYPCLGVLAGSVVLAAGRHRVATPGGSKDLDVERCDHT